MNKDVKEILYEITLKCNKSCPYCGSNSFLNKNKELSLADKKFIANQIATICPDSVTITGGEPSVVMGDLIAVSKILHEAHVKVKVLTNGSLFLNDKFAELDQYVVGYGYSINELDDIETLRNNFSKIPFNKTVMITNFGSYNIDLFSILCKSAINFSVWQVQLTMGNEFQLDTPKIAQLIKDINEVESNKIFRDSFKIIRADNFTCGKCPAGESCFSITYNGDVVPCLSYRSWRNDMFSQGNVFAKSLKNIWDDCFKFYRNRKYIHCCKHITGIFDASTTNDDKSVFIDPHNKDNGKRGVVFVYGVVDPMPYHDKNIPMVYGVSDFPSIN